MYLLKFKLENNTEPCSLYECLNDEHRAFNRSIDEIKKEHTDFATGERIAHE